MQKNIYRTILSISMAVVLVFSAVVTAVGYNMYKSFIEKQLKSAAYICADEWNESRDVKKIKQILSNIADYDIRFTVIDSAGNVTADSVGEIGENHSTREEVRQAVKNGSGDATRVSETLGQNLYYYAVKTDDGVLRLSIEYSNLMNVLVLLVALVLNISAVIVVIVGIVSSRLSEKLTKPIEDLSRQISSVNMYSMRPAEITTDCKEIEPIAKTAEAMANEISNHLKEIERTSQIRREFTSNVSHELKTPLTTVRGFAEMMKSGMITDKEEIARTAGLIYDESDRLLNLINDIIELSHIEENSAKKLSPVRIDELINKAAELMRDKAVKNRVHIHIAAAPITAEVNSGYITELLINLIDNAVKYNKPDGNVWVSAEISKNTMILKVSDDGIGIAEEEQSRVFERFYRSDKSRSTQGTGLGLSIVKHIAAYHNADLEMYSTPGEGTTVVMKMSV
ncbi:MAG: ATP-binding protein [Firmicutes bacterium]|nr:ATP-binding protein [Bacillota bacterium]